MIFAFIGVVRYVVKEIMALIEARDDRIKWTSEGI
jgi:hypothetical protein